MPDQPYDEMTCRPATGLAPGSRSMTDYLRRTQAATQTSALRRAIDTWLKDSPLAVYFLDPFPVHASHPSLLAADMARVADCNVELAFPHAADICYLKEVRNGAI